MGVEPRGKVSSRAQQNGPASRLEEDSLPFLSTLLPQPLENDVTPLLHPQPDVALPCLHPQGWSRRAYTKVPPTLLEVANLQATLQGSAPQAPGVVRIHPALAAEGLVGSHSLHLWHRPKSTWEETLVWERQGGVDSGKRLFSYQRVIANANSCEHLCLWKMNRTPPPPPSHPSGIPAG